MINIILLAGNLGATPEFKVLPGGQKMARFSLATSTRSKNEAGESREHTEWHKVVIFRESTALWVKENLRKGSKVWVEGKLTYRRIQDHQGKFYRIPYIIISGPYGQVRPLDSRDPHLEEKDSTEFEYTSEHDPDPDSDEDSIDFQRNYFRSNQNF